MSIAPRSLTPLKQSGLTTGTPQTVGSAIPGLGIWKSTLRSALSICSSFSYCRWERLRKTGSRPRSKEVRRAECGGEWDLERDLIAVRRHDDPAGGEGRQLRIGVRGGANGRVELAVDHAVRAVTHDRELIRQSGIHRGVITPIGLEPDSERREELRVGDVLDLRADD